MNEKKKALFKEVKQAKIKKIETNSNTISTSANTKNKETTKKIFYDDLLDKTIFVQQEDFEKLMLLVEQERFCSKLGTISNSISL